jgi:hypothetical protein
LISPLTHGWVEVVDRLQQAYVADLHELFVWLRAVPVSQHAGSDERLVAADQHLGRGVAAPVAAGQRLDHGQQGGVVE